MKRLAAFACAVAAACAPMPPPAPPAAPTPAAPPSAAQAVAAAESAFAAHSVREGMRAAFIAHFSPEGLFVRDGWTIARTWLEARPDPPIILDWRPVHVEVSGSGDFGLSTGPWKLTRRERPADAPAFGQFISIWKRAADGTWRVAVDIGISHPTDALWDKPLRTSTGVPAKMREALVQSEEKFAREAREVGQRAAYASHASPRLRFYREGAPPALDSAAALAILPEERVFWIPERAETANSRDLGYVIGRYTVAAAPRVVAGYYMRVWANEDARWRIVLDVTNPVRPK